MARLLIACPTITGREKDLRRCFESYMKTTVGHEVSFQIALDLPSWGKGVNAILDAQNDLDEFDYIHLTADDLEAHDGWFDAAQEALKRGIYPAPLLLNPDGSLAGFGHGDANMFDTSTDWKPTDTSVIPTMTPFMWSLMGPMIPLHFFTDNHMSHEARKIGMNSVAIKSYCFTHHESQVNPGAGMGRAARLQHDSVLYHRYLSTGKWPEGDTE